MLVIVKCLAVFSVSVIVDLTNHNVIGASFKCHPQTPLKKCSKLSLPKHATKFSCIDAWNAGSICWVVCDEKHGYQSVRGQFTKCTNQQRWTNVRMECEDTESPIFNNCPTQTIVQTKSPHSTLTEVKWPAITVTDNSGEHIVPTSANSNIKFDHGVFTEGSTLVRLEAKDAAGNAAPSCTFIVKIQSVHCDAPDFGDPNMRFDSCLKVKEGAVCQVKCYLALQNKGRNYITCKKEPGNDIRGYWDYGQGEDPLAVKPKCQVHNCTRLRPPIFGSMTCDKWTMGTKCLIGCQQGFDIPVSVAFNTPVYQCNQTTGTWDNERVPDCAWREYGERYRMRSSYYFDRSCVKAKNQIKETFLAHFKEEGACPEPFCKVDNVDVRCGDEVEDFGWRRNAIETKLVN